MHFWEVSTTLILTPFKAPPKLAIRTCGHLYVCPTGIRDTLKTMVSNANLKEELYVLLMLMPFEENPSVLLVSSLL